MIKRMLVSLLLTLPAVPGLAQDAGQDTEAVEQSAADAAGEIPADLPGILGLIPDADYSTKRDLANALATEGSAAARLAIAAMLDGRLFYRNSDHLVVAADADSDPLTVTAVLDGSKLGAVPAEEYSRIGTNNQLRRALRGALASLDLSSKDSKVRLAVLANRNQGTI